MSQVRKMDRKTRKLLTMKRMNRSNGNAEGMYLPREGGSRSLTEFELKSKQPLITDITLSP